MTNTEADLEYDLEGVYTFFGYLAFDEYEDMMAAYGEAYSSPGLPTAEDILVNQAIEVGTDTMRNRVFTDHIRMTDQGMIEAAVREAAKFLISEIGMPDGRD